MPCNLERSEQLMPRKLQVAFFGVFFYYSYNRRLHYFSEHHVKTNALFLKFAEGGVLLSLEQEL